MLYKGVVKPGKMALVFMYECPFCHYEAMLASPLDPATVTCGACKNSFHIAPVDRQTVQYIQTVLMNGRAAAADG
ncbi:MAG: hypothetical protein J6I40_03310 [Mailhella sp.]|nr:hypothetical protein [Mailhella sp.]